MGKKFFSSRSPTSSYLWSKRVHEIFSRWIYTLKDSFLGIFDFKNGFPDLKKPWYQFLCIQLPSYSCGNQFSKKRGRISL